MFLLKLSGPVHTVSTVTGISTDGLNSTVQVRVTPADPIGRNGLAWSLVTLTEIGAGTKCNRNGMLTLLFLSTTLTLSCHSASSTGTHLY